MPRNYSRTRRGSLNRRKAADLITILDLALLRPRLGFEQESEHGANFLQGARQPTFQR